VAPRWSLISCASCGPGPFAGLAVQTAGAQMLSWFRMPKQLNGNPARSRRRHRSRFGWAGKLFGSRDRLMRLKLVGSVNRFRPVVATPLIPFPVCS
jgi:hypothetical protein